MSRLLIKMKVAGYIFRIITKAVSNRINAMEALYGLLLPKYRRCEMENSERGLTPEKVVKILEKHGTKVTLEEAKTILIFMKKLARITVNQYLRDSLPDDCTT